MNMNRKMMKNNHKEHKNYHAIEERPGSITGIQDKHGDFVRVGDKVQFVGKRHSYTGILLYHRHHKCYGIFFYPEKMDYNVYDQDSYMCFVGIPTDNGSKMNLEILEKYVSL